MQTQQDPRILALLTLSDLSSFEYDEVTESHHTENCYELGSQEWLVLADWEADALAAECIKETLWAFNPSFLQEYMVLDEEMIGDLTRSCEDSNAAMVALVGDRLQELIADAIALDGRGHFTSFYDGEEYEVQTDSGEDFLAYRVN